MKEFITLDNEMISDWRKAFKLNYDWDKKVPAMIAATLALSTSAHLTPPGYYLAKQKLEVGNFPHLGQELILTGEITKKTTSKINRIIGQSAVICIRKTLISLYSMLIKPETEPVIKNPKPDSMYSFDEPEYWHTFTLGEVNAFTVLSGDTNYIHTGANPVVPGMLILLILENYLALHNCFFKHVGIYYHQPVRVNDPVKLQKCQGNLYGIVEEKLCFKLNFQEER